MATKGECFVAAPVTVDCNECGRALDVVSVGSAIWVIPCEMCIAAARDAADLEGYERGFDEGVEKGGNA